MWERGRCRAEQWVPVWGMCVSIEERGMSIEERGVSIEERGVSIKERGVSIEKRGMSIEERGVSIEQRGVSIEERGVSIEERGGGARVIRTPQQQQARVIGKRKFPIVIFFCREFMFFTPTKYSLVKLRRSAGEVFGGSTSK